jgi:hypothetical protein
MIAAVANRDGGGLLAQPQETAAFHQTSAVNGLKDRHADVCQGAHDGKVFTVLVVDPKAVQDRLTFDNYGGITRVDSLGQMGRWVCNFNHLHALGLEGRGQVVVLSFHFVDVWSFLIFPIPRIARSDESID